LPVAELLIGTIDLAAAIVKAITGKKLLTGGTVRRVERQLAQVKEKLESAKEELYQVGKDVLDYKNLSRKTTESMRDCLALKDALNVSLIKHGYKKASSVLDEVVSKAYDNLAGSINDLESCADALDVKASDPVIEKVKFIKDDIHDLESRLKRKRYSSAARDVGRMEKKLRIMEYTIAGRMYDKVLGVVKTLK
jgi:hypothetical protein